MSYVLRPSSCLPSSSLLLALSHSLHRAGKITHPRSTCSVGVIRVTDSHLFRRYIGYFDLSVRLYCIAAHVTNLSPRLGLSITLYSSQYIFAFPAPQYACPLARACCRRPRPRRKFPALTSRWLQECLEFKPNLERTIRHYKDKSFEGLNSNTHQKLPH
ncbi:hypothetical protein F4801DRAFT_564212 [Xylaria longipes]|nr:hypothetical protein F4801DRAFT_564212 [Xylaria longipes]